MKLSKKSEYACLALIDLSRHYDEILKIMDISIRNNIPKKYLEQILILLKQTGYAKSIKGPNGGYKLAKLPGEITIAEIIRLIDGPLAPVESVSTFFYEHTPIEQNQKLVELFKDIRDYISRKMESTTFKDLL